MRAIDADALIEQQFKNDISYKAFVNLVKRQPTIEERKDCITCRYNDYEWYNEPCDSCTGRHKHWRPARKTGKWIPHKSIFGGLGERVYTCDQCGYNIGFHVENYCPNCGAKMER